MKPKLLINILFSIFIFVIFYEVIAYPASDDELQKLKSWMTGSFSSEEQSIADSNFYNIHLEMVQIWKESKDTIWLYVEQAFESSLDKPYRQRVYRLIKKDDGAFESAVFTLNNPLRFAGAWKEERPLNQLIPDSLSERTGCAIILEFMDGVFVGSTVEKNCVSNLHGALYATSEVRIEETVLTSWDRGFDANDAQVWGSETGPYIFQKIKLEFPVRHHFPAALMGYLFVK